MMNQDPIEAIDDSDPGKENQFSQDHLTDSRGNNVSFYMCMGGIPPYVRGERVRRSIRISWFRTSYFVEGFYWGIY